MRAIDHTTTTEPSRLASNMWVVSNGCRVPGRPSTAANMPNWAYSHAKVHGSTKGQVTSRSYQPLARTIRR
ncbi:hypothetical protein D3C71_1488600 [compost metagenome]